MPETNNRVTCEARCDSLGKGGEPARKEPLERSKILNSNWKGNADMMLFGLKLLNIAKGHHCLVPGILTFQFPKINRK